MVGFGDALHKSRRPGWEDAYLDYEGLKAIRHRLEEVLVERDDRTRRCARIERRISSDSTSSSEPDSLREGVRRYSTQFATKLHCEVEKVTLFCLARVGDLAEAVGALRFDKNKAMMIGGPRRDVESAHDDNAIPRMGDALQTNETKEEEGFNFDDFGERGSLLPASTRRSYSNMPDSRRRSRHSFMTLFSKEKLCTLISCNYIDGDAKDVADAYTELGVELLHLLKFACLNAVGVRKIVKKYEKTFLAFPSYKGIREATPNENSLFMPSEVVMRVGSSHYNRLLQLASNQSFTAIYASLLDALTECEKCFLLSLGIHESFSDPLLFSKDAAAKFLRESKNVEGRTSLLRFECSVSSIHAIQEFFSDVSKPFQVFLSRKAMIGPGKDRGELGSGDKKAINLLSIFEPDFLLDMTEDELLEWYQRATSKVSLHKKNLSVDNAFLARQKRVWGGVDGVSMIINLASALLYTVNYYIISPTANHYAILLGADGAFGASLIGASSLAAIFAAFLYSVWYTRSSFRSALIFSSVCPLLGNLLYALAITYESMKVAIAGRILCGLGSAEVVNRQLISTCVSFQSMTRASAIFVTISAIGMSVGPLLAAIIDMTAGRDTDIDVHIHLPGSPNDSGIIIDHVTIPGFFMAALWGFQLIALLTLFDEPERINITECDDHRSPDTKTYGSMSLDNGDIAENDQIDPVSISNVRCFVNSTISLSRTIFQNAAFPVTLYLFAFIELSGEVLISSCSMIVRRYFGWHGSSAGFIIASLGALVLPAHFIVEMASRSYSERRILNLSIIIIMFGIIAICNIEGLALDFIGQIVGKTSLENESVKKWRHVVKHSLYHDEFPYDWGSGVYVYLTSLSIIFISTIVMEGVNTSLMAKTAPRELNNTFINMGLLATLVGTFGRVIGDSMIVITAMIGKSPLHDFVSVTFLPMFPMIALGSYLVHRYYNFFV